MVQTTPPKAEGMGLIPGWEAEIPRASQPKNQNIKQKQCCSEFNKDFKNGPHQKESLDKKNLCVRIIILNLRFGLEIENARLQLQSKSRWLKLNSFRKTC